MAEKEPESAPQEAAAAANDPVGNPGTPEPSTISPGAAAADTVATTTAAGAEPPVDAIGAAMESSADELNDQAAIDELLRQASLGSADMGGGCGRLGDDPAGADRSCRAGLGGGGDQPGSRRNFRDFRSDRGHS